MLPDKPLRAHDWVILRNGRPEPVNRHLPPPLPPRPPKPAPPAVEQKKPVQAAAISAREAISSRPQKEPTTFAERVAALMTSGLSYREATERLEEQEAIA